MRERSSSGGTRTAPRGAAAGSERGAKTTIKRTRGCAGERARRGASARRLEGREQPHAAQPPAASEERRRRSSEPEAVRVNEHADARALVVWRDENSPTRRSRRQRARSEDDDQACPRLCG